MLHPKHLLFLPSAPQARGVTTAGNCLGRQRERHSAEIIFTVATVSVGATCGVPVGFVSLSPVTMPVTSTRWFMCGLRATVVSLAFTR